MTNEPKVRAEGPMFYLDDDIRKVLKRIHDHPLVVREFEDHELLALAAWTQDSDEHIKDECVRRAESGRRFAHYLGRGEHTVSGTLHLRDADRADQP